MSNQWALTPKGTETAKIVLLVKPPTSISELLERAGFHNIAVSSFREAAEILKSPIKANPPN